MRRALLPTTGVVAAVAAAVSGWAPLAQSSPSAPAHKGEPVRQQAPKADSADGTYESCGAYFGFGKDEFGVLDVVEFDVADQNGSDGVAHAVPTDTQVVLVLTNEGGDTIECAAVEVTEEAWNAAMDDIELYIPEGGHQLPAWPGPGHYAYPSIAFDPSIEEFGDIVDVEFKVVSQPEGHTLVSPTGLVHLTQHQIYDKFQFDYTPDPRVLELIAAAPSEQPLDGPVAVSDEAAADGFVAAMAACDADSQFDDFTDAMTAGTNALLAFRGFNPITTDEMGCFDSVGSLHHDVSFQLGLDETTTYSEPIVLALPEEPTTTTTVPGETPTTTTTQPTSTQPEGATPIPGSPAYTG